MTLVFDFCFLLTLKETDNEGVENYFLIIIFIAIQKSFFLKLNMFVI